MILHQLHIICRYKLVRVLFRRLPIGDVTAVAAAGPAPRPGSVLLPHSITSRSVSYIKIFYRLCTYAHCTVIWYTLYFCLSYFKVFIVNFIRYSIYFPVIFLILPKSNVFYKTKQENNNYYVSVTVSEFKCAIFHSRTQRYQCSCKTYVRVLKMLLLYN